MPTLMTEDDEYLDPEDPAEQGKYGDRDQPTRNDSPPPDDSDDANPPAARQSDR